MQLCAGEGGFAITEPEDVQELFGVEVRSTNPDLGLLQLHENAALFPRSSLCWTTLCRKTPPVTVDGAPAFCRRTAS
jgi:hypothetical protein